MAVVYTAICAFENAARGFIEKKFPEEKGDNWWELSVKKDIRERAEGEFQLEKGLSARRVRNL